MAIEAKRGCGYRKIGGLYLVSGSYGLPCDRLPFPLTVCPCCSAGYKQTRGWTWVTPNLLFGGMHSDCTDTYAKRCPVCTPTPERAGLLWIGEKFYPSTLDFHRECRELGVSRRIRVIPRAFELGKTWVLLAHPKAISVTASVPEGGDETIMSPGIFKAWLPTHIETLRKESERGTEAIEQLEKRGITVIFVPDHDKDHQGSVYDKPETTEQGAPRVASQPDLNDLQMKLI